MASYYLDENVKNGMRKMHAAGCRHLPDFFHRTYLGEYCCGRLALRKAALVHSRVVACSSCCSDVVRPHRVRQAS